MLVGESGFLGRHLCKSLRNKGFEVRAFNHGALEITDGGAVMSAVGATRPDAVINCAAISSTAYANSHPEESMLCNVTGPKNLALACKENGAAFFMMSSDQVYGGCTLPGPLTENLPLCPNNIYGEHKLLMESEVLDILPSAVLLRLSWMYEYYNPGNPHTDILSRLVDAIRREGTLKSSTRELRGISAVDDVCGNIARSLGVLPGGVYNFGSGNLLDSYSTMQRVLCGVGLPPGMILPDDSWGRNLSMDCSKVGAYGISFPSTEEALVKYLKAFLRECPEPSSMRVQ